MLGSPDPLGERLTSDVAQPLRDRAVEGRRPRADASPERHLPPARPAPFGELLNASVREPALLLYLDAPSNRKDHPNENLARELMELFTLGIGNFTEADVKEAARALTGWTVEDGVFRESPPSTTTARRPSSAAREAGRPPTCSRSCSTSPRRPGGSPGGSAGC